MKLQKRFNRKVGSKEYSKWVIIIPPEDVEKLRWKDGEELSGEILRDGLVIRAHKSKSKDKESSTAANTS